MMTHKMITIPHSFAWSWEGSIQKENQDAFLSWSEGFLWMIADGVGSSKNAGEASKILAKKLTAVPIPESFEEHLKNTKKALHEANSECRTINKISDNQEDNLEHESALSTVVVLILYDYRAACLWAGDSRCYLLRNNTLYQCTKDHSLRQQKIDTKELTIVEAHRMIKSNIITNAVGVSDELYLSEVHFPLLQGDKFLLCSDGLSNIISADTIHGHLTNTNVQDMIEDIKESLIYQIVPDNITCIGIFLSQEK